MKVKEFKGNPKVYVASHGGAIEVTTEEHMRNANKPLEVILKEICVEAEKFAEEIVHKYDYPDGQWYPCGSADVVLKWNEHREIIKLFQKQANRKQGDDWWEGWFGRLFKTSNGWWWKPNIPGSQSMLYEEEVCRFVRQKLALANIRVDIHTYID